MNYENCVFVNNKYETLEFGNPEHIKYIRELNKKNEFEPEEIEIEVSATYYARFKCFNEICNKEIIYSNDEYFDIGRESIDEDDVYNHVENDKITCSKCQTKYVINEGKIYLKNMGVEVPKNQLNLF